MRPKLARVLGLTLALAVPCAASADREETYALFQLEPGFQHSTDPVRGAASTNAWGDGLGLVGYYGLTNTLHLGGALRVSRSKNLPFDQVTVTSSSGSSNTGRLYADATSFAFGSLGLYRFDTGRALAPAFSLEAGLVHRSYSNVALIPQGASYGLGAPGNSESLLYVRTALSLEYRFWERFVTSVSVAAQFEPGGLTPWQISVPLTAGMIW